jgi:hypothetical protein
MKENLLQSRFDELEEPEDVFVPDASMPLGKMLDTIFMRYPTLERSVK